ncbi:MAG: hypothetical protein A3K46_05300 [Chloroflexi bacterium RBG_13_60_9]|nr:MAG: hypothetical protein A3K46_05300 [Chloroflexi bacterium RBG_13_60_9]
MGDLAPQGTGPTNPTFGRGPVSIDSDTLYSWADLPLCHVGQDGATAFCENDFGNGNNRMSFPINPGDTVRGKVWLMDTNDNMSGDDLWCDADFEIVAPELENFIPGHEISFTQNCDEGYGLSRVMISVFFNPEWSSYAVGSNADLQGPSRPRESDLQVINVSRNSWGNLRVTVYNHGPDGLGNAPIQLAYGIANYEPGMPPPPPTAYWERYFLNVSPYGETSFDTGLPLPEDHELYLRIILSMVVGNITDPEADNNSSCWHIVPDGARPADDSHCPGG